MAWVIGSERQVAARFRDEEGNVICELEFKDGRARCKAEEAEVARAHGYQVEPEAAGDEEEEG